MAQDTMFPNLGGASFSEDVFYRILDDLLGVGVVGATDYQAIQTPAGANMAVTLQPGNAYVAITNGGKRRTRLAAQSNSGLPGSPNSADNWITTFVAADGTNPRIDRVVITARDTSVDGSGASNSAFRVIAGTPTSGATLVNLNGVAAVPPNSMLFANVLVPASATTVTTANISDQRTTAKIGGNITASKTTTGTWAAGPPGSPADGDIWNATAVGGVGSVTWQFRYNASAATYKWEFVGGPPIYFGYSGGGTTWNNAAFTLSGSHYFYRDVTTWRGTRAGNYYVDGKVNIQVGTTGTLNDVVPVINGVASLAASGQSYVETSFSNLMIEAIPVQGYLAAIAAAGEIGVSWNCSANSTIYDVSLGIVPERVA